MFELTHQGFSQTTRTKTRSKTFLAWHHTVAQVSIACETLSPRPAWTGLGPVSNLDPVLQNPRHRWFCTLGTAEVAHHTCWEVQSYHALSCLCTAAPSPKDSQYSSVPFFIAAGYKTLVIPETTQIQCLNPETTIMKITDLQSKAANRSTTQWMLLGGEVSLWKSTNCS